jgi:hypothetical protein
MPAHGNSGVAAGFTPAVQEETMKRALIVLVIIVVVAGFIRGWFAPSAPHREENTGRVDVNVSVDPQRMKEDAEQVKDKAVEIEGRIKDELRDTKPDSRP